MYKINTVAEFGTKLAAAYQGDFMARAQLKEALSTSDMPELFRQFTDYAMLAQYARLESVWSQFSQRFTVPDFRPQRFMTWNTNMGQLLAQNGGAERKHMLALPRVPELTEYPTFSLEAEEELFSINKYGARYPFSFEVFINDEFGVIPQLPTEMAQMARDTEDVLTTGVLAGATGPNPDFFNDTWDFGPQVPPGNIAEGNPPLSIEAVEAVIQSITSRYINNRPVMIGEWVLVVPPSLEIQANNIAAIANYQRIEVGEDGIERRFEVPNPVRGRFRVVVNRWLPLLDTSGTSATTWYMLPAPGQGPRNAIITTFMAGREQPELRISGDTGNYIGGGEVPGTEGSFPHDDVQYRVRHITGAVGVDPSATMASLGTGTDS